MDQKFDKRLTCQQSFSFAAIWSWARRASTKLKAFSKNLKAARPRDTRESWPSGRPLQVDCAFQRVLLNSLHTRRSENMTSREIWNFGKLNYYVAFTSLLIAANFRVLIFAKWFNRFATVIVLFAYKINPCFKKYLWNPVKQRRSNTLD